MAQSDQITYQYAITSTEFSHGNDFCHTTEEAGGFPSSWINSYRPYTSPDPPDKKIPRVTCEYCDCVNLVPEKVSNIQVFRCGGCGAPLPDPML